VRGTDTGGILGPDLTHFGSRGTIAAGLLSNTPVHLAQWLAEPQRLKPGTLMPQVQLTSVERARLVSYLEGLS
jgi:cytochrome c oxidase subunit 2